MSERSGSEHRQRIYQVGVRLLPEEYGELSERAQREGCSLGEILRRAAFPPRPPEQMPTSASASTPHQGVRVTLVQRDESTPHPCLVGAHAWAWLTTGGQECARCGARR